MMKNLTKSILGLKENDTRMDRSHYENVKGQIGHCGLWCGSCIVGNGLLAEMTRKYEKVVCGHGVQKWGLKEKGDDFVASLHSIEALSVCPGCLKGGGDDTCRMRECTKEKGLVHCDECGSREECPHQKNINFMHEGGKAAGMFVVWGKDELNRLAEIRKAYLERYPGNLLNEQDG